MPDIRSDNRRERWGCLFVFTFFLGALVAIGGFIMVVTDRRGLDNSWPVLLVGAGLMVSGVIGFYVRPKPLDEERDYLNELTRGQFFNRDGFAFVLGFERLDDVAWLVVHFQNQRDCRILAAVILELEKHFWESSGIPSRWTFPVKCGARQFGVARFPVAIPRAAHGGTRSFYVGAHVEFPDGEGGLVRHSLGQPVGELTVGGKVARGAATLAMLSILHHGHVQKPLSVEWLVPNGLSDSIPSDLVPIVTFPSRDEFIQSCPRTPAYSSGCVMLLLLPALAASVYVWVDSEIPFSWRLGVTSFTLLLICVVTALEQRDRRINAEPHWLRLRSP
jgi:hypothetical protein